MTTIRNKLYCTFCGKEIKLWSKYYCICNKDINEKYFSIYEDGENCYCSLDCVHHDLLIKEKENDNNIIDTE